LKFFRKINRGLESLIAIAKDAVDLRDVLIFGGQGMIFHGLYQWTPWIAYVVSGVILMAIGIVYSVKVGD